MNKENPGDFGVMKLGTDAGDNIRTNLPIRCVRKLGWGAGDRILWIIDPKSDGMIGIRVKKAD